MKARAECGNSKRASGQLTIIVRDVARGCPCSTPAPFAADHVLESLSVTNNGSGLVGGSTRGYRGMLAVCSHPLLENRLCSERRRFALPRGLCFHLRLGRCRRSTTRDGGVAMACVQELSRLPSATRDGYSHELTLVARLPTDPAPCHACRDEGGIWERIWDKD